MELEPMDTEGSFFFLSSACAEPLSLILSKFGKGNHSAPAHANFRFSDWFCFLSEDNLNDFISYFLWERGIQLLVKVFTDIQVKGGGLD
jgi:hypothetical protein